MRIVLALVMALGTPMASGDCQSPKQREGIVVDRNASPCKKTKPGDPDSPCAPRDYRLDTDNSSSSFSVTKSTYERCEIGEAYPACSYTENRNKYVTTND